MNYTRYVFLVLAAVISALTSCSSVRSGFDYAASGLNKVVNPDAERMRSGIVWNKPAPRVGRSKDRTVYVVMEDISGLEIPAGKIESEILSKLESKGYEVVDDIDNAYYRLEVFLRYFGPNPRADRGRNPAIFSTARRPGHLKWICRPGARRGHRRAPSWWRRRCEGR